MSNKEDRLLLLEDLPAATENDEFHHKTYAHVLRQTFESVGPGSCVSLFGRWGQGKSSIVKMLDESPPVATKVVVFNAWQSQGDSIRRQMLLRLVEALRKEEASELKKFFGLSVSCTPEEKSEDAPFSWKHAWSCIWGDKLLKAGFVFVLVCLIASIVSILRAFSVAPDERQIFVAIATGLFLPAVMSVAACLFSRLGARYKIEVSSGQQSSESLRLEYPEQFRDELMTQVTAFLEEEKCYSKVLLVVDDLDRCDADTVVQALSAIRQFSDRENSVPCQFLVPCDEKQVVLALETAGHDAGDEGGRCHDYCNEELLRKFFDVVVRMDAPLPQDMVSFAEKIVSEGRIGLTAEEARETVALAAARVPREVKKLLNGLAVAKAKREQSKHLLPKGDLKHLEQTERFLVVLRETAPLAYEALGKDPMLIETEFKPDADMDDWSKRQFERARELLNNCPDIPIPTATVLLYGRLPKELRNVKAAGLLVHAVIDDSNATFEKAMNAVSEEEKTDVQAWLSMIIQEYKTPQDRRRLFSHLVDYAFVNDQGELSFVEPCLTALAEIGPTDLTAVLNGFKRHDALEIELPEINRSTAELILSAVHDSFKAGENKNQEELKLLIRLAKVMSGQTRSELETWLCNKLKDEKDPVHPDSIGDLLPLEARPVNIYGQFPRVAEALAGLWGEIIPESSSSSSSDESEREFAHIGRLIADFVGDDDSMVTSCMEAMMADESGILGTVKALDIKTDEYVVEAFKTVRELFQRVSNTAVDSVAEDIFTWYDEQDSADAALLILHTVSDRLVHLGKELRAKFVESTGKWLVGGGEYFDVTNIFPDATCEKSSAWHSVIEDVIASIAQQATLTAAPSDSTDDFFIELGNRHWVRMREADALLAEIVAQNTTAHLDAWAKRLAPLSDSWSETLTQLHEALRNQSETAAYLSVGIGTAWSEEIGNESARVLASVLLEEFEETQEVETFNDLWNRKGSALILDAVATQLRTKDATWLMEHRSLLEFLAVRTGGEANKKVAEALSAGLEVLLTADADGSIAFALAVGAQMLTVAKSLKERVTSLRKSEAKTWEANDESEIIENSHLITKLPLAGTEVKIKKPEPPSSPETSGDDNE